MVACRRRSPRGGSLLFLINVERRTARTTVTPAGKVDGARDLIEDRSVAVVGGRISVELGLGEVAVFHLEDAP